MEDQSPSSTQGNRAQSDAAQAVVLIAATVGLAAAVVGLVDGIVLMAKRKLIECPNGTYFPPGTKNFDCFAHPRMAEGLAVSAISLTLAALLLVTAIVSVAMVKTSRASGS